MGGLRCTEDVAVLQHRTWLTDWQLEHIIYTYTEQLGAEDDN